MHDFSSTRYFYQTIFYNTNAAFWFKQSYLVPRRIGTWKYQGANFSATLYVRDPYHGHSVKFFRDFTHIFKS